MAKLGKPTEEPLAPEPLTTPELENLAHDIKICYDDAKIRQTSVQQEIAAIYETLNEKEMRVREISRQADRLEASFKALIGRNVTDER